MARLVDVLSGGAILGILIAFALPGCNALKDYQIIAVWYASEQDPLFNTFYRCDECNTQSTSCCVLEYANKTYDRGESYILNGQRRIDSVYSYNSPMGATKLAIEDQIRLSKVDSAYTHNLMKREVFWNKEERSIYDGDSIFDESLIQRTKHYLIVSHGKELVLYEFK